MPPKVKLSTSVQELWDLVEALYGRQIAWQHEEGLDHPELGGRIGENGTPIIRYQDGSTIDDMGVSHELLHLWRFGCGVPIVNLAFDKFRENTLTKMQNDYEHLWIYSLQSTPPFNMQPWNPPHSEAYVDECIERFKNDSGDDLSWGSACDALLSKPATKQVNRSKVSAISPREAEKIGKILALWRVDSLDVPHSAAVAFTQILEIMGLDLRSTGFRWQGYDGSFIHQVLPRDAAPPRFSTAEMLTKARSERKWLLEINRYRREAVSMALK